MKKAFFLGFLILSIAAVSQQITILDSGQNVSIRGLSVLNDSTFWLSGTAGTVAFSSNSGHKINWFKVAGYEKRDFRDIHAFTDKEVIIMAVDNPAIMLKTYDAGSTWKKVYELNKEGMFLDAFAFNDGKGLCIGDPIDNQFFILQTKDFGDHWWQVNNTPKADSGEACFASSGTNIAFTKKGFAFVSGGLQSHLYTFNGAKFNKSSFNFSTGSSTSGANALLIKNKKFIVVGGNFLKPDIQLNNFFYSKSKGNAWYNYTILGYKSSIEKAYKNGWIACGTSGVAFSNNLKKWQTISEIGYHVVQKAQNGTTVYLAGGNGKVAKLIF